MAHQLIEFKIICSKKNIYSAAPTYFNELLSIYAQPMNLRRNSTGGILLNYPIPCNKLYAERAFSVSALCLWNSLPLELRLIRSYNHLRLILETRFVNEYYFA